MSSRRSRPVGSPRRSRLDYGAATSAEPDGGEPAVELLLTDASDDRPGQATGWRAEGIELQPPQSEGSPAYVAEARFLAQRLRELADAGVPRGDMVVLLRAFTHVDAYEEALERAGLSPYVVGGRGYWSQQQVEDVLRLLGVVANPLDDELLFGALASPACGVSPDALWLLRQATRPREGNPLHVWPTVEAGEWPATIAAEDSESLDRFRELLAGLRRQAPLLPLDSLIDRTISAFDYDLALLARPGGRRRMANVRKLMRLAAEYEEHEGRNLRGFLGFAAERTLRDEREGMAAVQVEGHDGVRVMTVHAAKGLEFPVVAVADLGRGLGAGSRDGDVAIGRIEWAEVDATAAARRAAAEHVRFGMRLPIAAAESLRLWELVELCEEERRADIEEACRLVYVAVSRAEDRLILSGIFKSSDLEAPEDPKPAHSALKLLLPALRARGWAGGDGLVELDRAVAIEGGPARGPQPRLSVRTQAPSAARAAELRRRMPWPSSPAGRAPDRDRSHLLERFEPGTATGRLSYSALATYSGCRYRFYVERVLGLDAPIVRDEPTEGDAGERSELDESPAPAAGPRERSLAIGNAVHAALEASARRSWSAPAGAELETILARAGLDGDGEARGRVEALVDGWLASELRAELVARRCAHAARGPVRARAGGRRGAREDRPAGRASRGPPGPRLQDRRAARGRPGPPRGALRDAARPVRARRSRSGPKRDGGRSGGLLLPRGSRASLRRAVRRGQGRRGAGAPGASCRGDSRRRLRAHRESPPRALLRLPGGGAAVREARLAAPVGGLDRRVDGGRPGSPGMSARLAVFAYGSLASLASAERTLGRPVESAGPARLAGWRRSWSQARDNLRSEKTFARADGTTPSHCLGLNIERRTGPGPNGALIEVTEEELDRLAVREIRYDRVEVTAAIAPGEPLAFDRVVTFTAKRENHAETPPAGAVILASYARAVEAAFDALGPGQLELFRQTTDPPPVEVVEGVLVRDRIPAGNPREW